MISHTGTGDLSTSLAMAHHGTGHVGRIGSSPAEEFARPTFAAGALLWRHSKSATGRAEGTEIEIALIHRPRYDDWTLPKGKVDPGENLPGTAVREIREETGFEARLGWLLGYVHYPVGSRTKVVYYWTAEAIGGKFEANEESDDLKWVAPNKAAKMLSYDIDRDVVEAGRAMLALGCDRRVLYIRHGKAHDRKGWGGDDDLRPLNKKGRRQSEMLTSAVEGYRPEAVFSAKPDRCVHTATPVAQDLGLTVEVEPELGDAGWSVSPDVALSAVARATADTPVSAVIAQGAVIPGVLARLAGQNGVEIEDLRCKKSSIWVLHFAGEELLGLDYLASPLPVK
ncbi:NUDIX hydrolase [Corynebacterium heidelbergense]|uniref:NTP pyrophosphohydrolase n=1 Tax=Corynebacterium heidelbergense TaxID=2055947 RepID=A0A364V409_9CORY|nr:bifunctional NUDIX hydrolase/histidine phosphatase family protein [Corynebacterium heidelbergense]RAV31367.1 NTP pyrophosphohydrolase [Corynebacterium heidelbergense]